MFFELFSLCKYVEISLTKGGLVFKLCTHSKNTLKIVLYSQIVKYTFFCIEYMIFNILQKIYILQKKSCKPLYMQESPVFNPSDINRINIKYGYYVIIAGCY